MCTKRTSFHLSMKIEELVGIVNMNVEVKVFSESIRELLLLMMNLRHIPYDYVEMLKVHFYLRSTKRTSFHLSMKIEDLVGKVNMNVEVKMFSESIRE